jgi:hypothetical protein
MTSFEKFWKEHAEWSQRTFGSDANRGPEGPLKHLLKEAQEALDAGFENRAEEIADCFLLVCDAARRYGMTWHGLLGTAHGKLEINKTRTYPNSNRRTGWRLVTYVTRHHMAARARRTVT